jgi:hypothetical protein
VQSLGRHDVPGDQPMQWRKRHGGRADLVGERRDREVNALAAVALALAVDRLVLTELLEQHHGQQVRPHKTARRDMERRGRLRDGFTLATAELLPHRLDHLPLAWNHLQGLGDVLTQLRQLLGPTARA